MMAAALGFKGKGHWVVGVEDDPEGGVRVYLDARYLGRYCVITDAQDIHELRSAWSDGGHVFLETEVPADCIYTDAAK